MLHCLSRHTGLRTMLARRLPRGHSLASRIAIQPLVNVPAAVTFVQRHGKKTKTVVRLDDLPQGPLKAPQGIGAAHEAITETPAEPNAPAYPTVVLQARKNMDKFDNCVLLTRVGGFYELYFEHAEAYGPLLNLKVASKKTSAGPVPMAGFPFFQLDRFLKILVQDLNRYVAVAEEFPNSPEEKIRSGGLMHDRRVARIITPGTLIDESFIDPYANNYVLSIHIEPGQDADSDESLGLAWLDLSTGHFFTQATDMGSLSAIISRINPREIVLDQDFEAQKEHSLFALLAEDRHLITYSQGGDVSSVEDWTPMLESPVPEATITAFTSDEKQAGSLLLNYIQDRLQGLSMKLQPPLRHQTMQIMSIDKNCLRALEIRQTIRDGFFRGSLLHAIRRTVTKSGARLLNEWLSAPSTSIQVITQRQDLVARFLRSEDLRDTISMLLRQCHDSQRLVQRFAMGKGDADDLLGLSGTIAATRDITDLLRESCDNGILSDDKEDCLVALLERIDLTEALRLAKRIRDSIDEDGVVLQHEVEDSEASQMMELAQSIVSAEGNQADTSSLPKTKKKAPTSLKEHYGEDNEAWIMKPAASPTLKKLHSRLEELISEKDILNDTLREQLGASSLTLRWTPGLGHIAHIKGKDVKHLTDIRALSASRSTRSFHLPEWTSLGQKLDQARFQIRREEQRVFQSLRENVVVNLVKLRRNAAVLDELDIAVSFATLAAKQQLIRPILNDSTAHTIVGGRHPTVEGGLVDQGRTFVQNDCLVGNANEGSVWLITGPNMAGKSTFLRQNALITILAQIGCYVPATYAELGIVDAIYSRVGSADSLYHDQSTFMVEMLETAHILRHATPRSFVIMDEIGRGTTPEDGTAVSFACLHHLVTVNKSRTLFATHFHGVADLAAQHGLCDGERGSVQMYCTDVDEDEHGGFAYVHKLRRGINRKSHALKVATLAGLPEAAIEMARVALRQAEPEDLR